MGALSLDPRSQELVRAAANIDINDHRLARWGVLLVILGFGGFLLWSWLAPLDAGIVATATVKVTSNRKAIQHLTGGSVEAILVREGDSVSKDQELVRLDATQALSEQGVVNAQFIATKTMENRLQAERDGVPEVIFDPAMLQRYAGSEHLNNAILLQRHLFTTRRAALEGEIGILRESQNSAEAQIKGLQHVYSARSTQLGFLNQELVGIRQLAAEGYVPRNRMLELERTGSDLNASQADNLNNIARARGQVAEIKLRILQRGFDYRKEVQSLLADVQKENSALTDRLQALDYQVRHTVIRSPINGVVQGLNVSTIGGVIAPGFKIMEIVPAHEPLQIDAMVPVQAIDRMTPGLPVTISFPAFNHVQTPNIPGQVLTISADRLVSDDNKQPYYLAQIEVTPAGMAMLGSNHIRAGMPASVTIKTGERNMLSYLLKPLLDRVNSAFKEQ